MDQELIKQGVSLMLQGLGVDLEATHFQETPQRVAKAWADELCTGLKQSEPQNIKTFPLGEGEYAGMVVLQHIPVKSVCAHHLLPFVGEATVAYLPQNHIFGLSKLSRIVNHFARRPQVQELLTSDIANYIEERLNPLGVGVIIKASHMCMELRGVEHSGLMTTSDLRGGFLKDPTRSEFMSLAHASNHKH